VASDICEYLSVDPQRIHVVPYYPDPELLKLAISIRETEQFEKSPAPEIPHFITLASHEPRKNLELAIRAIGLLHSTGLRVRLTCAGGHTPYTESLMELARQCGVADCVEFPGYVERRQAVRLMLGATALIFVSTYEGYGMPPLEAMSVGCPVVLSDIACHRQIYGDGEQWGSLATGLQTAPSFVMPDDAEGLAAELRRLAEDKSYRSSLVESGAAYSALFTPQATAKGLQDAFQAALAT